MKRLKTSECLELTKISRSSLYRIKKEMLENNNKNEFCNQC